MKARSHEADDLQDILQEFMETVERPDVTSLEKFVRKYPHYAAELTDFAAEWLLEELSPDEPLPSSEQYAAVSRAMSYLQNRLYEMEHANPGQEGRMTKSVSLFSDWTPPDFKRLAGALEVDNLIVAKVRDRKLIVETIPDEFTRCLATELQKPVEVVNAYMDQPAVVPQWAEFKASGKPEAGRKESFRDAIEHSTMSDSQKARWLYKVR